MAEQKILLGSTQTLLSYPRVGPGGEWMREVPASCEVRIGTPAVSLPSTYDAATVDSVDTTTTAASEGDTSLTVASMTAVKGRRYLVGTLGAVTGAQYIEVESARAGALTSAAMQLAEPLPMAVPASSPVKGWAVSHPLTATETAQAGECLALWRAVIGGVSYEWSQAFRIVRRIPVSILTPTRLTQSWPVVRTMRSRQDLDLEEIIRVAWEHRILPWAAANSISEEDIVAVDALEPLHAIACVQQLVINNPAIQPELRAAVEDRWNQLRETTLARKDWYDVRQEADPPPRPDTPPLVRTGVRLVR